MKEYAETFCEGFDAHERGDGRDACPYSPDSPDWRGWMSGWEEASDQAEETLPDGDDIEDGDVAGEEWKHV